MCQVDAQDSTYPQPPAIQLERWQSLDRSPTLVASLAGPSSAPINVQSDGSKRRKLSSSTVSSSSYSPNFWRKAKWSPDGKLVMAQSESHHISILLLEQSCSDTQSLELENLFKAPSPVLETAWYSVPAYGPSQDKDAEAPKQTWCYAQSCRDVPIKLVDSSCGNVKASYAIMDHVERFVAPHSLAFSLDQSRLYCGEWSQISVYPLASPGLNRHSRLPLISSRTASTRATGGQRGFVSALAVAPCPPQYLLTLDETEASSAEIVACGTFSGSVGLYVIQPSLLPPPADHNVTFSKRDHRYLSAASACLAGWMEQDSNGIHQLAFHPLSPHILFVSSRKSDFIHAYDTRYLIGAAGKLHFRSLQHDSSPALVAKLQRLTNGSHQRLTFEMDWAGRFLASGDEEGYISLWRIDRGRFVDEANDSITAETRTAQVETCLRWKAHNDAVGSVSFHPFQPLLLSVAGSRHWPHPKQPSTEIENEQQRSSSSEDNAKAEQESRHRPGQSWFVRDASMKVWNLG